MCVCVCIPLSLSLSFIYFSLHLVSPSFHLSLSFSHIQAFNFILLMCACFCQDFDSFITFFVPFFFTLVSLVGLFSFLFLMSTSGFALALYDDENILRSSKSSFVWIWFQVPYILKSKWKIRPKRSVCVFFFFLTLFIYFLCPSHIIIINVSVTEFFGTFHWSYIGLNLMRFD